VAHRASRHTPQTTKCQYTKSLTTTVTVAPVLGGKDIGKDVDIDM
jgi:hypothetical protein